jgi:putative transcriptional regulator
MTSAPARAKVPAMSDAPPRATPPSREGPRVTGLARHVLCAVPQLVDPNFVRSVVLIVDHSMEGAFGLVVNHRLTTAVADMAAAIGLRWAGDPAQTVGLGGPVEPSRGFILHDQPAWDPLAEAITPGVFLTTSLDALLEDAEAPPRLGGAGARVLVLLGYAGWGEGQLESEMASGSWLAVPVRPGGVQGPGVPESWLWSASPEAMWSEALGSIGVDPGRLVGAALGSGKVPQA